jgi:hypothetical protein
MVTPRDFGENCHINVSNDCDLPRLGLAWRLGLQLPAATWAGCSLCFSLRVRLRMASSLAAASPPPRPVPTSVSFFHCTQQQVSTGNTRVFSSQLPFSFPCILFFVSCLLLTVSYFRFPSLSFLFNILYFLVPVSCSMIPVFYCFTASCSCCMSLFPITYFLFPAFISCI